MNFETVREAARGDQRGRRWRRRRREGGAAREQVREHAREHAREQLGAWLRRVKSRNYLVGNTIACAIERKGVARARDGRVWRDGG
jgi:hypothetical protein